jgi:hypothetical protein
MNAPQVIRDNLKISYKDKTLADPYVTVLEIASTGRSAIPSSSFDNGRSLQLKLAAEIETVLSVEHKNLIANYKAADNSDSRHAAASLTRVLGMLAKLPREGTGNAANRDLTEFKAVMNQTLNPNERALGC